MYMCIYMEFELVLLALSPYIHIIYKFINIKKDIGDDMEDDDLCSMYIRDLCPCFFPPGLNFYIFVDVFFVVC